MKLQRFRKSATPYEIDGKPYCDEPVRIQKYERGNGDYSGLEFGMWGPCRKCEKCLYFRRRKWGERIFRELEEHQRSWFVVLTFDPVVLAGIMMEARRLKGHNRDPEAAIERAAYEHLKRWFKRLRKSGGRFRYVAVPEYGEEGGRLHYHVLLHELEAGSVPKRLIEGRWRSVTYARVVKGSNIRTAMYVSKYLTKSLLRPRASFRYGKDKE